MVDYAPGMRTIIRDEEWMVKKVEKNKRVYILPTKIGEVKKVANVEEALVKEAWKAILPEVNA